MDIRRFFSPVSSQKSRGGGSKSEGSKTNSTTKAKTSGTKAKSEGKKSKKRAAVICDSDSDEEFISKTQKEEKLEPNVTESSAKAEKNVKAPNSMSSKNIKEDKSKLKPATVSSYFSDEPVKRSDAKDFPKKRKMEVVVDVDNFNKKEKEVINIEDSADSEDVKTKNESTDEIAATKRTSPQNIGSLKDNDLKIHASQRKGVDSTPQKKHQSPKQSFSKSVNIETSSSDEATVMNGGHAQQLRKNKPSPKQRTSPRKASSLDESVPSSRKDSRHTESSTITQKVKASPTTDEEHGKSKAEPTEEEKLKLAAEKKRTHFLNYKNFMEREGPRALGTKAFPKGKEGCFCGLTFIITGVLECFERDDVKAEIEKYGGKVVQSVSKKTSYIIIGRDAGQSKLEKAEKFGTKKLSEDEFLDLLAESVKSKDTTSQDKTNKVSANTKSVEKGSSKSAKKTICMEESKTPKSAHSSKSALASNEQAMDEEEISEFTKKKKRKIDFEPAEASVPKKFAPLSKVVGGNGEVFQMWVDKYKPTSTKQIIGQQGDRSNVKKLANWLNKWHQNRSSGRKPAFGKFGASDDGSAFRAALLSGPPGIGKTTSAQLVCKEAGFDFVELNASDQRSKKSLKEEIAELTGNQTLSDFFSGNAKNAITSKHVIIMDEVDGMSGNEDRGGVQELISLIKSTKVPIICICNDRSHPKIRSLVNYCYDLRFYRPRVDQMKAAMLSIAYKEGVKIPSDVLQDVIVASNQDIRQVLHNLSVWCAETKCLTAEQAKRDAGKSTKDIKMSPFDALRQVFARDSGTPMSIYDKSDLFFTDYSIMPLFVQENYLQVHPSAAKEDPLKHLQLVSAAADSISDGDLVDKIIRTQNSWSLLPVQAIFASVVPGDVLQGYLSNMINFPSWLGKNSARGRVDRLLQELHMHMRLRISGNKTDIGLDYLRVLRDSITQPLIKKEAEGVSESLYVVEQYCLLREDVDNIVELSLWPSQKDPMSQINSKVKAAFTRAYNKEGVMTPYSIISTKKLKRGAITEPEAPLEGEEEMNIEEADESDDDLTSDAMVKVKQPKAAQSKKSAAEISDSKGKGRGKTSRRGRGKR